MSHVRLITGQTAQSAEMGTGIGPIGAPGDSASLNRSNRVLNDVATTAPPRTRNAVDPDRLSDLNSIAARTAPRLPPAPTIPETDPTACGQIRGTTAKVTPHAIHTNNPKSRNATVAGPRT